MADFDLVVVGDANPDVLISGAPAIPPYGQAETLVRAGVLALGGSAAIVAHGAARLGLHTALVSVVGRDATGDFVLDALASAGVDITAVARHEHDSTALTVCLGGPDGDRAILTATGCMTSFDPLVLPSARHVHVASYFLQPRLAAGLSDLFANARAAGATTSLDTNHDPADSWELAPSLLESCDYLLPSQAEALALAGTNSMDEAVATFADAGVTPVVKLGKGGAVAHRRGENFVARVTPVEPVDTVGAEDSFVAGFLAGVLNTGDLSEALAIGCACGALSTLATGGTAAQPSWNQAVAYAAASISTSTLKEDA